jgi:2-desacetyl-2-hydroxyethyl bacteriochlorophyllide A dehydrogenase
MSKTYPMAIVTAPGKIEFQDKHLPGLNARDVLVKIKAAAICGSDLHIYKGLHPSAALPVPIGHEASGEIIDIGGEVTKHKIGDRVTMEPVITCGACEFCKRGQYNLCTRISFQYRQGQGAFSPYYIVNEERAFKLPEHISFEEGALVEPLSVALHAVKKSGVSLGQSCAIFGAGAIGLLVTMLVRQAASDGLFVSDINPFRLSKALEFGARHAINSQEFDPVEYILENTAQLGVDHSFEAVGLGATLIQALTSLKKGGSTTLLGIFEQPGVELPANIFIQKEIKLIGSQGYCWDFKDAITLLENKVVDLKTLVTHRVGLEKIHQGFEILMNPQSQAIKVLAIME